jgi:predicted ABC-type ATPase
MNSKPLFLIMAGPNGAGKTTVAEEYVRDMGLRRYLNADVIASGLSYFDPPAAAGTAASVFLQEMSRLVERRESFAIETTLASRSIAAWLKERLATYRTHMLFLHLATPDLAVARVAVRVRGGGHSVPESVVRRRYRRGLKNFFSLYSPLLESWQMVDNGDKPARLIASSNLDGRMQIEDEATWDLLRHDYGTA